MTQTRPWFVAKEPPGIGVEPGTWEGWLATALFVGLLVATPRLMDLRIVANAGWLRRLPGLHDHAADFNLRLVMVGIEGVLFIAFARWKSDGPWLPGARRGRR